MRHAFLLLWLMAAAPVLAQSNEQIILFVGADQMNQFVANHTIDADGQSRDVTSYGDLGTTLSFQLQYNFFTFGDWADLGAGVSVTVPRSFEQPTDDDDSPEYDAGSAGWGGLFAYTRLSPPALRQRAVMPYFHLRGGWNLLFSSGDANRVILDNNRYDPGMSGTDLFFGGGVGVALNETFFAEVGYTKHHVSANYVTNSFVKIYPATANNAVLGFRVGLNIMNALDL